MVNGPLDMELAAPSPLPYGLLSPAALVVENNDDRWIRGFTYETVDGTAQVRNLPIGASNDPNGYDVLENPGLPVFRQYLPFDIDVTVKSSTFGTTPEEQYENAKQVLDAITQKAVEKEFWTGGIAQNLQGEHEGNRWLSSSAAINITPGAEPVKIQYGKALLELALGEATIGSTGVIHAPRSIASALGASDQGGFLATSLGTKVVAGAGYSNTSPTGEIAPIGTAWMYATGPVTVTLGKIAITPQEVRQAVDTQVNTIQYYISRPAAVTWSTSLLYAVHVDLRLDYA